MKVTDGRVRVAASDVANFLACRRLTQLDLARARGELRPPREFDIGFQELCRRGEDHEGAVWERCRADRAAEVYRDPVEHCAICRWRDMCRERRRTDDDLSLVAGMTTGQRRALKGDGISTRRGFAGLADLPWLDRVSPDVLGRAQRQA